MKYGLDDIKKAQEVMDFIEERAREISRVFLETWNEIDGRRKVLYDGNIDYILEINSNQIVFSTWDTCMGQSFQGYCEIPMKYFVSDDYEAMMKRDILNEFEDEKREAVKRQEEQAAKQAEDKKKTEEEEYRTYLALKEKYESK